MSRETIQIGEIYEYYEGNLISYWQYGNDTESLRAIFTREEFQQLPGESIDKVFAEEVARRLASLLRDIQQWCPLIAHFSVQKST